MASVVIPDTFKVLVLTSAVEAAPAVTVTRPAEIVDRVKLSAKLIADATPTKAPPSDTETPVPVALTPDNPEPSPTNEVALSAPVTVTPVFVVSNFLEPL